MALNIYSPIYSWWQIQHPEKRAEVRSTCESMCVQAKSTPSKKKRKKKKISPNRWSGATVISSTIASIKFSYRNTREKRTKPSMILEESWQILENVMKDYISELLGRVPASVNNSSSSERISKVSQGLKRIGFWGSLINSRSLIWSIDNGRLISNWSVSFRKRIINPQVNSRRTSAVV